MGNEYPQGVQAAADLLDILEILKRLWRMPEAQTLHAMTGHSSRSVVIKSSGHARQAFRPAVSDNMALGEHFSIRCSRTKEFLTQKLTLSSSFPAAWETV